jgi:hypothetical protein
MAPSARFRAPTRGERTAVVHREIQVVYNSPSLLPLGLGPPRSWNGAWVQTIWLICRKTDEYEQSEYEFPCCGSTWWGARSSRAAPGRDGPCTELVLLFTRLLASPLPGQRGFYTLLLAGLQVKGVAFHFLDNVFLLHLALKTAQSVLEGFTLLQPNFCQTYTPPNPSGRTE